MEARQIEARDKAIKNGVLFLIVLYLDFEHG
jgi:hypothetical protein